MEYGKSILLEELLKAADVDYDDVGENRFWIVCPICNEAIFKVVRPTENSTHPNRDIHYFAHYCASKAYASDCLLRVSRLTQRQVDITAVKSRAQKLKYFIGALNEAVRNHFGQSVDPDRSTDTLFRRLRHSGTFAWYRNLQYAAFQEFLRRMSDAEILASFDYNIKKIGAEEKQRLTTTLSLATQKRIALDLVKYLKTSQGKPSFECLFDHAYIWFRIKLLTNTQTNNLIGIEKDLLPVLDRLPNTSRPKALSILANLQRIDHTHVFRKRCDALDTLVQHIFGEILLILISIPYFEILRKSVLNRRITKR